MPNKSKSGRCIDCGKHHKRLIRDRCLKDYRSWYTRTLRQQRHAAGQCTRCGSIAVPGMDLCQDCREARNVRVLIKARERTAQGLCPKCGKPSPKGRTLCKEHMKKARADHRAYRLRTTLAKLSTESD